MSVLEEWEKSLPSRNTRDHHLRGLRYFSEFTGEKPERLLRERRRQFGKSKLFETKTLEFYEWLQKTRRMTGNSARSYIIAIQSFFSYYDVPLRLKRKLPNLHMKLDQKKLTPEDLRTLYKFNDLTIKTWLALSRDCSARISDLLEFKRDQIKPEFLIKSNKESIVGKVFLSEETIDLFERFWKTIPESKYAFSTPSGERYDPTGINKMLKRASKKAGLEDLKITQHSFRKLWITTAINLGMQTEIIKILSFKSVDPSLLTYFLDREDLRDQWQRVTSFLSLEPRANGRVDTLNEAVDLILKTLRKMILKEVSADQASGYLGLVRDYSRMTLKEILEEYLKEA